MINAEAADIYSYSVRVVYLHNPSPDVQNIRTRIHVSNFRSYGQLPKDGDEDSMDMTELDDNQVDDEGDGKF